MEKVEAAAAAAVAGESVARSVVCSVAVGVVGVVARRTLT